MSSNAIKFTEHAEPELRVTRTTEDSAYWITFVVRDSGIGMAPEQLGGLFQAFTHAADSTTRKYGGAGLGLAISQEICPLLGDDITVESTPGVGSTFTVRLPEEAPTASTGGRDWNGLLSRHTTRPTSFFRCIRRRQACDALRREPAHLPLPAVMKLSALQQLHWCGEQIGPARAWMSPSELF